jgi:hypothetical protein
MSKPKAQGTAWETFVVNTLKAIGYTVKGAKRIAEGGALDIGDIEWEDGFLTKWIGECKATQTLNVTRVLGKARKKSGNPYTVVFWKRLTKSDGKSRRTPDGEPMVVVMAYDTFMDLMKRD